jgi:Na+/H+ antiporter NhaD/arsenite permease-like protein
LAAAGIHLASTKFRTSDLLGLVEWPVLILFMGLFVVTGSFQSTGYGDQAVRWLAHAGFNLNTPHTLIAATTLLANLINNAAAVMMLLKVIDLSHPTTAYILALANSFGGSLIIIGSVSNLIVIQQAHDMGITIRFWDFARLSIPATLVALGGLLLWAVC